MVAARGGLPGSADAARARLQTPHRPASLPPEHAVLTRTVQHVIDVEHRPIVQLRVRCTTPAEQADRRSPSRCRCSAGSDPLGDIVVSRAQTGGFSPARRSRFSVSADQAGIAIDNVRLFREIQDKSRQLETASQHKCEFLANMSHELRTPLNAISVFQRS